MSTKTQRMSLVLLFAAVLIAAPGRALDGKKDEDVLVRGGQCGLADFQKERQTTQDQLIDMSVLCWSTEGYNAQGKGVQNKAWNASRDNANNLISAANAPAWSAVCITTVKQIKEAGGTVAFKPVTGNPNHCEISGISPEQAYEIFKKNKVSL